jgi:hypothetical protein
MKEKKKCRGKFIQAAVMSRGGEGKGERECVCVGDRIF